MDIKIYISGLLTQALVATRCHDQATRVEAERLVSGALWMHAHDADLLDWFDTVWIDYSVSNQPPDRCMRYWLQLAA